MFDYMLCFDYPLLTFGLNPKKCRSSRCVVGNLFRFRLIFFLLFRSLWNVKNEHTRTHTKQQQNHHITEKLNTLLYGIDQKLFNCIHVRFEFAVFVYNPSFVVSLNRKKGSARSLYLLHIYFVACLCLFTTSSSYS